MANRIAKGPPLSACPFDHSKRSQTAPGNLPLGFSEGDEGVDADEKSAVPTQGTDWSHYDDVAGVVHTEGIQRGDLLSSARSEDSAYGNRRVSVTLNNAGGDFMNLKLVHTTQVSAPMTATQEASADIYRRFSGKRLKNNKQQSVDDNGSVNSGTSRE